MTRFSKSLIFFLAAVCLAQDRGTITGIITDPAGAAVPGATVKGTNPATGQTQTSSTNNEGTFNFLYLPAGKYTVTAEKAGFRMAEAANISVNVSTTVRVDLKLEVGQISDKIEVTSVAPVVVTERSDLGTVVTTKTIIDLPLS